MLYRLSAPLRTGLVTILLGSLSACATLPASGPTAGEIKRRVNSSGNTIGFRIADITAPVLAEIEAKADVVDRAAPTLAGLAAEGRNDVVGPGDVLGIGIFEVGVSLFGTSGGGEVGQGFDSGARNVTFPAIVVDRQGGISLPYIGRLQVAGRTPPEIQDMIVRGLRGKSQSPQAVVAVRSNLSGTVYVGGDVRKPGRFELTLQRERLLDAIALGGGAANSSEDTLVRFNRGSQTVEERLGRIRAGAADDLVLIPGDRIELIKRPRSFIVLGATTRVSQVAFETGDLSLAEAVARAGGPQDERADPSAVFLFRYDPMAQSDARAQPVIYRLNMMEPASYFLAQKFAIRDKDVIYIANAAANRPTKMVSIINQLFTPFVTARVLTQKN
ncbi:polysaccharide biosynthesis/export family protein [Sphingomonas sp. BIUV-7]|uniref:Polysaccharide biosynthesis/export family protein n=1 Tax=Sphingomonas natans TaxID=3063330 RepID=A0ABT8Y5T1_9SPHN|nr:polysaccharide biosynthesis/export family protein [Sphingomonas sp. BIUV-7]MDO6413681.1 polysaccharide biosynthesis/export family protein [Sphingomonas sp. BIUV-7]